MTATHIVWKAEDGLPDICSPLANDEFVFLLATYGTITCYDAEKGDQLWTEDFNEDCMSSPEHGGKTDVRVCKKWQGLGRGTQAR